MNSVKRYGPVIFVIALVIGTSLVMRRHPTQTAEFSSYSVPAEPQLPKALGPRVAEPKAATIGQSTLASLDQESARSPQSGAPQSTGKYALMGKLPPHEESDPNHLALLEQFKTDMSIQLDRSSWVILRLRAIPKDKYRPGDGEIVTEKLGAVFVPDASESTTQVVIEQDSRPVVANPSNGSLGIITGTLLTHLKEGATKIEAENLAREHGLVLKYYDSALALAYLGVPAGASVTQSLKLVQTNPNVVAVSAEIVSGNKRH